MQGAGKTNKPFKFLLYLASKFYYPPKLMKVQKHKNIINDTSGVIIFINEIL